MPKSIVTLTYPNNNFNDSYSIVIIYHLKCLFVRLCFTTHQQRGHLETAPPFYCPLRRTLSSVNTPLPTEMCKTIEDLI